VKKALEYGAVDTLLLSKDYDKNSIKELKKIAGETGTKIEIVSTETEEGKQFFNLSGVGALLRYITIIFRKYGLICLRLYLNHCNGKPYVLPDENLFFFLVCFVL